MSQISVRLIGLGAVLIFLLGTACATSRPGPAQSPTAPASLTPVPPAVTPKPTAAAAPVVAPRASRTPARPTLTPSPVAVSDVPLCWYPPLHLSYDPNRWVDTLPDTEDAVYCYDHFLQSTTVESCTLREQGPSDYNGTTQPSQATFNGVQYAVLILRELQDAPGQVYARYMAQGVIAGFSYERGSPLLILHSATEDWDRCVREAEAMLGTLYGR